MLYCLQNILKLDKRLSRNCLCQVCAMHGINIILRNYMEIMASQISHVVFQGLLYLRLKTYKGNIFFVHCQHNEGYTFFVALQIPCYKSFGNFLQNVPVCFVKLVNAVLSPCPTSSAIFDIWNIGHFNR